MTLDRIINILVTITLVEMMVTIGLSVTTADLLRVARDWRLVAGALVANYVAVPAVTVVLLLLFDPPPLAAVGFLILAVCPGAPYGPPLTAVAKGDVAIAVGLMAILAGSSAVLAPLLLTFLMPLVTANELVPVIDGTRVTATLLGTQLLPLAVGLAVRFWRPELADRIQPSATLVSKILNAVAVAGILITQYHLLIEIRLRGFLGMLILLGANWAAGWLLSEPDQGGRKAMTLTAALRNVGVGLVIATGSFGGSPAVTAVLAFGLVGVVGSGLLAWLWGGGAFPFGHTKPSDPDSSSPEGS